MELENLNPERAEDLDVSEMSDDALDDISGGNTYTTMDGYTFDDGLSPDFVDTMRWMMEP